MSDPRQLLLHVEEGQEGQYGPLCDHVCEESRRSAEEARSWCDSVVAQESLQRTLGLTHMIRISRNIQSGRVNGRTSLYPYELSWYARPLDATDFEEIELARAQADRRGSRTTLCLLILDRGCQKMQCVACITGFYTYERVPDRRPPGHASSGLHEIINVTTGLHFYQVCGETTIRGWMQMRCIS